MESFYNEIDKLLTKDLNWKTGHNLNAFNDLLRGGFGVYDYLEPVKIIWIKFNESQMKLGDEVCKTLLEIIADHDHITLEQRN